MPFKCYEFHWIVVDIFSTWAQNKMPIPTARWANGVRIDAAQMPTCVKWRGCVLCVGLVVMASIVPYTAAQDTAAYKQGYQRTATDTSGNRPTDDIRVPDESRLLSELISRYAKYTILGRPLVDSSKQITVQLRLILIQILDFDEKNQVLTTLVWKDFRWYDDFLKWDPSDYGGLNLVSLPSEEIWTPDIVLYNNVEKRDVEKHEERVMVNASGMVQWIPPVVYKSSCYVDVTEFPFDEQTCTLRFGSWSYSKPEMDLVLMDGFEHVDMSVYMKNTEWDVVNTSASRQEVTYSCCDSKIWVDVRYHVHVRRTLGFYTRVMLFPTLMLSLMVLLIFWIPPQRPDRTSLAMSLFTSFMLLLLLVVDVSPPSSKTKLGGFCCLNIIIVTSANVLSVFTINLTQIRKEVPHCIKRVFVEILPTVLCICPSSPSRSASGDRPSGQRNDPEQPAHSQKLSNGSSLTSTEVILVGPVAKTGAASRPPARSAAQIGRNNNKDWVMVVRVLDRIMFVAYAVLISVCVVTMFPYGRGMFILEF